MSIFEIKTNNTIIIIYAKNIDEALKIANLHNMLNFIKIIDMFPRIRTNVNCNIEWYDNSLNRWVCFKNNKIYRHSDVSLGDLFS